MKNKAKYFGQIIFTMCFALIAGASAATFTVTNTNDSGAGSLRQAVLDANAAAGDDIIAFDSSFNVPRTITLASLITVTGSGGLTINGTGANLLTISANNGTRVFELSGHGAPNIGAIVFNNLTIADVLCTSSECGGGGGVGINNGGGAPANVNFTANNVVFRNIDTGVNNGGAIFCTIGTININNSIFTGGNANGGSAISGGNGIGTCNLNINNSSFYENSRLGGDNVLLCCGNGNGTVVITNSAFYNNGNPGTDVTIRLGGGNQSITNTTIANNVGSQPALSYETNNNSVSLTLTNVTIAGNRSYSTNTVGGFQTRNINTVNIRNSIIANNFNPNGGRDLDIGTSTTFNSQGYNLIENIFTGVIQGTTTGNLIGVDPWLDGRMRDNGGATKTLALRPGSPAIDAGDPTAFPATDQRGISRPQDGDGTSGARADIGAYERRPNEAIGGATDFDFEGDGKTDLSIFRPAGGEWWYLRSSDGSNRAFSFGISTDKLVPADYTGDGKTDLAIFRPSTGEWFVLRSEDNSFYSFPFGASGDIPTPADFDGDGTDDVAIFRPTNATWYIIRSSDGGTTITTFGATGDQPVAADYDGDGKADVAVFRPSDGSWWLARSTAGVMVTTFGTSSDKTVQADYTGDGKADVAIFRPSTGVWFILRSEDFSFYSVPFGASGDTPAPGDYDGDGIADVAIFRPSNATWYISGSTSGAQIFGFGANGDQPIPNAYVR